MNMLMMRRLLQSTALIMTCAVAACSGADGDESTSSATESKDVAAPSEQAAPAQEANLGTGELGKAEQAICKCSGFEGDVICSTTGADFPYPMCSGSALNRVLATCRSACAGGSCVIHPATNC
jgi:hypothetical protein